jgi:DNA-binding NarL/FixJ family response regulator
MDGGIAALVVVSQELFGNGLKSILCKYPNRLRAHVSTSFGDALAVLEANPRTQLAILDIDAPGVGAPAVGLLRERFPAMRIILAAPPSGRSQILACLGWGVHGVVLTTQSARDIIAAVRVVMGGGIFVPAAVCEPEARGGEEAGHPAPVGVVRNVARPITVAVRDEPAHARAATNLSARQSAVLMLLVQGFSNKAIGRELGIAEGTVKVHLAALYKVLRVRNRASAVASMATTGRLAVAAAGPMAVAR